MKDHPMQAMARELFRQDMIKRLAKKPWIADHSASAPTLSSTDYSDIHRELSPISLLHVDG